MALDIQHLFVFSCSQEHKHVWQGAGLAKSTEHARDKADTNSILHLPDCL